MNEPNQVCQYCNSIDIKTYKTINNYVIYYCKRCNLLFTRLSLDYDTKKNNSCFYSNNYLSSYENRTDELSKRFQMRLRDIEVLRRGGNLLDVGCSTALFLRTIEKKSNYKWKLFGIDINKKSIQFAQAKIKAALFCTSLHKRKFKGNFFDCITCFDVLEHDADIRGNLKEIYRILKPGGLLVIQAPNYKSIMTYLCGQNWDWWSVPDHVLHFSPPALSKILVDNGFIVKRLFTWEPAKEFVENVRGSIKKKVTKFIYLNKILNKVSIIPLYALWIILLVVEKKLNVGGLTVIYAIKN